MALRRIYPDKTSIVFMYEDGNSFKKVELSYNDIISIRFDEIKEKKLLLIWSDSEQIVITTGKLPKPIVYTKNRNKKFFDIYKQELRKFAKDNFITFAEV